MIFQVVAVHLVRNLYYFRGKASKIQHSSVYHTPGQALMHLSKFLIHIQATKGVEIMYNFCCFPVDPVLNSPEHTTGLATGKNTNLLGMLDETEIEM